jgi:hypothetical protein
VLPAGKKVAGPPRGVKAPPRSPKQLEVLRTSRARNAGKALDRKLDRLIRPGAAATIEAYVNANDGNLDELNRANATRLAKLALAHDEAMTIVGEEGVLTEEAVTAADGTVLASRKKAHPALDVALRLADNLGLKASDQLLTKSSRGTAKRDDALASYLSDRAALRAGLAGMLKGAEPIDVEVLPDAAEKDEESEA